MDPGRHGADRTANVGDDDLSDIERQRALDEQRRGTEIDRRCGEVVPVVLPARHARTPTPTEPDENRG